MEMIEEIKVHKNKETQRFRCSLLHREAGYLVLSYRTEQPGRIKDIIIPSGLNHHCPLLDGAGLCAVENVRP